MSEVRRPRQRLTAESRRAQIVATVRDMIADEGYQAVSLRAVAARCNVSLSAVQHHYPDKNDLFKEVIDSILVEYDQSYEKAILTSEGDPERRLRRFMEFLICKDIKDRRSSGFFYELWHLAQRDEFVASGMSRLYDAQMSRVREMVHAINPELTDADALRRAAVITATADGLMLTLGHGKDSELTRLGSPEAYLVDLIISIVFQPPVEPGSAPESNCQGQAVSTPVVA